MVLMGAEQVPGDQDLTVEALDDIAEMQSVKPPRDGPLNLFVQLHENRTAYRYRLDQGSDPVRLKASEAELTDGTALKMLLRDALAKHRPDHDRAMLVLWGHSYDFAIGRAVTRSGIDALDFSELA